MMRLRERNEDLSAKWSENDDSSSDDSFDDEEFVPDGGNDDDDDDDVPNDLVIDQEDEEAHAGGNNKAIIIEDNGSDDDVSSKKKNKKKPVKSKTSNIATSRDESKELDELESETGSAKNKKDDNIIRKAHPAYIALLAKVKDALDTMTVPLTDDLIDSLRTNPSGAPYSRKGPRVDHRVSKWNRRSRSKSRSRSVDPDEKIDDGADDADWGIDSRRPAQRSAATPSDDGSHRGTPTASSNKSGNKRKRAADDGQGDADGDDEKSDDEGDVPASQNPPDSDVEMTPAVAKNDNDIQVSETPKRRGRPPKHKAGAKESSAKPASPLSKAPSPTKPTSPVKPSSLSTSTTPVLPDKSNTSKDPTTSDDDDDGGDEEGSRSRFSFFFARAPTQTSTPAVSQPPTPVADEEEEVPRGSRGRASRKASLTAASKTSKTTARGRRKTRQDDDDEAEAAEAEIAKAVESEKDEVASDKDEGEADKSYKRKAPASKKKGAAAAKKNTPRGKSKDAAAGNDNDESMPPPPKKKSKKDNGDAKHVASPNKSKASGGKSGKQPVVEVLMEFEESDSPAPASSSKEKGKERAETPPIKKSKPAGDVEKVMVVRQVLVEGGDMRYRCVLPCCDKDFLNVGGLKYHLLHHTHEILEFLAWAYPPGENAPIGSGETVYKYKRNDVAYTFLMEERISPEILEMYRDLPVDHFPITLEGYHIFFPGLTNPSHHDIMIGWDKTRKAAHDKRMSKLGTRKFGANDGDEEEEIKPRKASVKKPRVLTLGSSSDVPDTAARMFGQDFSKRSMEPKPHSGQTEPLLVTDWTNRLVYEELRPRVNHYVKLTAEEAALYVPPDSQEYNVACARNGLSGEPESLGLFETHFFAPGSQDPRKQGFYAINVGCAVWGMGWAPDPQYLAIAGYRGTMNAHHILGRKQEPQVPNDVNMKGIIQFWSLGSRVTDFTPSTELSREPKLELCIAHDFGDVFDLEWCPYGGYESEAMFTSKASGQNLRRLGLLAVSFGNGSTRVLSIPEPRALRRALNVDEDDESPLYVHCNHFVLELTLPNAMLWKLSWGGHSRLASGTTHGAILIWSMDEAVDQYKKVLDGQIENVEIEPLSYAFCHDGCVTALSFRDELSRIYDSEWRSRGTFDGSIPKPTQIISAGTDGRVLFHDTRMMSLHVQIARFRTFLSSCVFTSHHNMVLFADNEHVVRQTYMGLEDPKTAKSKEEDEAVINKNLSAWLMPSKGFVWNLNCSKYLPFVAAASSDGTLRIGNFNRSALLRSTKPVVNLMYRLEWNEEQQLFVFVEGHEETSQVKGKPDHVIKSVFPQHVTIQKAAWSANRVSASWLASGGRSGLVRLESTFDIRAVKK
ncbi:hypothetical protein SmJEL517_g04544 [Synchytrium microbalum]|uniref:C2H2-type domain-containing protein n=1 Tax=Synchytrium microbalum TaxID=1806994 RepID=A0A507BYZ4_9FUNG|nr:uncharacterized protein SmJEL517_g04544 [Synchytrium microbalum]TPX32341.1 hypothetical protein SmJEL517_g04544 [Synchytrium microbalum]